MTRYPLSAHYVRRSLRLSKLEQKVTDLTLWRRERNMLVFKMSETQFVCVYAFGSVVLFGIDDKKERDKILRRLARTGEDDSTLVEGNHSEDYPVIIDHDQPESIDFSEAKFKKLSIDKLLLVFHVLAQSVAMEYFEHQVEESLRRFGVIQAGLAKHGRFSASTNEVMRTIGMSGATINFILGQLSLLDKPDVVWEDKDAEVLFIGMRKMFELEDRFTTLRSKLTFIQDSSILMLDSLQHRRSSLLELAIIGLFVFEIVMAIFVK